MLLPSCFVCDINCIYQNETVHLPAKKEEEKKVSLTSILHEKQTKTFIFFFSPIDHMPALFQKLNFTFRLFQHMLYMHTLVDRCLFHFLAIKMNFFFPSIFYLTWHANIYPFEIIFFCSHREQFVTSCSSVESLLFPFLFVVFVDKRGRERERKGEI